MVFLEPGLYESLKLNRVENKAQQAWQGLRHLAILKYSRFLWSMNRVKG